MCDYILNQFFCNEVVYCIRFVIWESVQSEFCSVEVFMSMEEIKIDEGMSHCTCICGMVLCSNCEQLDLAIAVMSIQIATWRWNL